MTLLKLAPLAFEKPPTLSSDIGVKPVFKWIAVDRLVIDTAYQRQVLKRGRQNIRAIVETFDWSLFAPLVVAPRGGGVFAIIDGQHRALAAVTHGGMTELPCYVIAAKDPNTEARAFVAINGQVTQLGPQPLFRARLAAGDAETVALDALCGKAGLRIMTYICTCKANETLAIGALTLTRAKHGDDILLAALRLVLPPHGVELGGVRAHAIQAAADVLAAERTWLKRLAEAVAAVAKHGHERLELQTRKRAASLGGGTRAAYATLLREILAGAFGVPVAAKPARAAARKSGFDLNGNDAASLCRYLASRGVGVSATARHAQLLDLANKTRKAEGLAPLPVPERLRA